MADNYSRQGETFRSKDVSGVDIPIFLVGAHVRVYKGIANLVCTDALAHSLSVPGGATFADITMEGAAATDYVRYWHDVSDPTATNGVKLFDGQTLACADPASFSAIKGSTGAGGTLRVEFYAYE